MSFQLLMPFYGDPALFRIAVESVVAQNDPDWRLLIVDNCYPGTEHTRFLHELDDGRIEYVRNERNLGIDGNFRRSVELATGSHASLIGADDVLLPDFVGRVKALVKEYPDATVIQPGVRVIDESGGPSDQLADRVKGRLRPKGERVILGGEQLATSLLRGDWTYFPSMVWSVDFLRSHPFPEGLHVVLDLMVKLEVAFSGGSLVMDSEPVFHYRRHRGSISAVRAFDGRRFAEERNLFAQMAERARTVGWTRAERAARWHLSSRLNAATRLPSALRSRSAASVREIARHMVGR